MKKRKKFLHYALIANISFLSEPEVIYEFYHQRQNRENFFKEAKNPFNAGKMPSQLFRGNEAYLYLVTIAYNCFHIFKKNICQQDLRRISFETFKDRFISHGAQLSPKNDKVWIIRMNQSFLYKTEAMGILTNIRKMVYFHHYLNKLAVRHID